MSTHFELVQKGSLSYLTSPILNSHGVDHGFLTNCLGFREETQEADAACFVQELELDALLTVQQVHGSQILDLRTHGAGGSYAALSAGPGPLPVRSDAICVVRTAEQDRGKAAIGIRTADCLPVVLIGQKSMCLVHAGWRGLAAGIIERSCQLLLSDQNESLLCAAIGPAAGSEAYQVGEEVIESIGEKAVFTSEGSSSYYLDLAGTAQRVLSSYFSEIDISQICTITDKRFHSYRRDGDVAGRNLTFIRIPQ